MTTALRPIEFDAPLVNPSPNGLYPATTWTPDGEVPRWLPSGVQFRVWNYSGSTGVWTADWNAVESDLTEDDVKTGERPEDPDPFVALTLYAPDECDMTAGSQQQVRTHVAQNLRLNESTAVESALATRLLADAASPDVVTDVVAAVSRLESLLAESGTIGLIHASPVYAAYAAQAQLIRYNGAALTTPLGHRWVFGGGYVDDSTGLGDTLVATSPTFGWRTEVAVRDAFRQDYHGYAAIAERSVVVGYEALVGAVTITP